MNSYWTKVTRTRIGRRRALMATGTAAAGAMLLAACGGGSNSKGDDRKTASLVTKPETDQAGQARRHLQASRSNESTTRTLLDHPAGARHGEVYARSFRRAPGLLTSQPVEYVGDTAASWELSPDKLTDDREAEGGKWHTIAPVNGRTVDTADVVYTWARLEASAPTAPARQRGQPGGANRVVRAVDDKTLRSSSPIRRRFIPCSAATSPATLAAAPGV